MEVSVRELKAHLSEYLRRAAEGEEVVVTSRGQPVARLMPAPPAGEGPLEAAVRRLQAQPWIRPGNGRKIQGARHPIKWPKGEKPLSQLVLEDRE